MIFQPLFPTFYAEQKLEIDNDKLKQFCYKQKTIDSGIVLSNVGGWHSSFLDPNIEELLPLTNIIKQKLKTVCEIIDFGINVTPDNAFINISKKGNTHKLHNHPGSFLSCVYYVDCRANKGNIVFYNQNKFLEWLQDRQKIKHYNQYNSSTWSVTPETGKLIIFPAWLEHEVTENKTEEDRISIVYNCRTI